MSKKAGDEKFVEKPQASQKEAKVCKQVEQELRRNQEKYRSAFEQSGAPAMIIENDMTISMANREFERLTGYAKDEIQGKMKWTAFVVEEDIERMKTYHVKRRKQERDIPSEYECKIINRSGEIKNILCKVGMIPGTRRSVASFIDITSRKRAEKKLKASESKLSAIIAATDCYIYTCSNDYRIEFMNKALIETVGKNIREKPCYEFFYDRDAPCQQCANEQVFKGEHVHQEIKNPKDGRWHYVINTPIFDTHGAVAQKQVMLIDITDRKLKEELLTEKKEQLRKENTRLKTGIKERYRLGKIVGKSPAMQDVYEHIINAASADANVVIYGESGTGKELVAEAIHHMSDRKDKPFVAVNCNAIPENLLESEFFGYKKGAFTGANIDKNGYLDLADGGTLFLDEIGEIGINLQIKLLRAIEGGGYTPVGGCQTKRPDIRIIAATNRNLMESVQNGLMRLDFFYRIHIIPIHLPPLRERKEDLMLLVDNFLRSYDDVEKIPPITGKMIEAMQDHNWPGNVRELQNTLHRYVTLKKFDFFGNLLLKSKELDEFAEKEIQGEICDLRTVMENFEKKYLTKVLTENNWHKNRTASKLGINRKTLFKKIKAHGIE
jgi:PAS domain S-box-containing protein